MATRFGPTSAQGSFANVWAEVATVTEDEAQAGRDWWALAREDVTGLATLAGVDFDRMRHVVAAVSPGVPWGSALQNVRVLIAARAAGRPLPSGPGCGLEIPVGRRHIEKAWAILNGADPALARGPKVEALAANLAGDMTVTTVDRHITMIATGGESRQVRPSELRRIGVTLAAAARARGIEPAVMMAALWLRRNRVRTLARIAL